jgi:hypothetical protein
MNRSNQTGKLQVGAYAIDISPKDSQFLYGYPFVQRYSTGIHDPLMSTALYIADRGKEILFITNDIIFVGKQTAHRARKRLSEITSIPEKNILVSATHTHSGPITVNYLSNEADSVVPKADEQYIQFMEDAIVEAGESAKNNSQPAVIGLGYGDSTGVGTNRRDPEGPSDHQIPVLVAKSTEEKKVIACMTVCSMHPTVLHEDSTLVSADFPGMARKYLQQNVFDAPIPILHHTGPAGNQSPRHVTRANTFEEAERIGEILGKAVEKTLPGIEFMDTAEIICLASELDLPRRTFPTVEDADEKRRRAREKLERLKREGAERTKVRTAEVDWFGAEETYTIAKAYAEGKMEAFYKQCLPAEIQVIAVGPWNFVGWPGEIFIEYALEVKKQHSNTFVISLSSGELQGYIVTREAAEEGGYEASNALFSYETGDIFVEETDTLLSSIGR